MDVEWHEQFNELLRGSKSLGVAAVCGDFNVDINAMHAHNLLTIPPEFTTGCEDDALLTWNPPENAYAQLSASFPVPQHRPTQLDFILAKLSIQPSIRWMRAKLQRVSSDDAGFSDHYAVTRTLELDSVGSVGTQPLRW